jgi:peptidoglycan hydrolase CwlO-like protein
MRIVPVGLLLIVTVATSAHAQTAAQSDQLMACHQKVAQLHEQQRPLKAKLTGLRAERKGVSSSGGEVARFKLANLDQEIAQITKQIDAINLQISAENKRCEDLAAKPKPAPQSPAPPTARPKASKPNR